MTESLFTLALLAAFVWWMNHHRREFAPRDSSGHRVKLRLDRRWWLLGLVVPLMIFLATIVAVSILAVLVETFRGTLYVFTAFGLGYGLMAAYYMVFRRHIGPFDTSGQMVKRQVTRLQWMIVAVPAAVFAANMTRRWLMGHEASIVPILILWGITALVAAMTWRAKPTPA